MSRPRQYPPDRVHVTLRLPADLHARLIAEADDRDVAANWLACRLLAEGLDRLIPAAEMTLTRPPTERPRT